MKRGFTLIELLAVIVILAIIALIATPIVLNIINDARESSTLRSVDFYLDAVEYTISDATLNKGGISNGTYSIMENGNLCIGTLNNKVCSGEELKLEVNGEVPSSGFIIIENGNIKDIQVDLNQKVIIKTSEGKLDYLEPKSFAEDSWDVIAANVRAGNLSKYKVGDEKEVRLTGFTNKEKDANGNNVETYTVRIANTSIPSECKEEGFSQTACGFVIEFVDIITTHVMNSTTTNVGGWPASSMRSYVNSTIYDALPEELRDNIKDTYVVSGHGSDDAPNKTTTDKLYLLSTKEVWEQGTTNKINFDTAREETRQLDYYESRGVTTDSGKYSPVIKKYNGSDYVWWLRSACSNYTSNFYSVIRSGDWDRYSANITYGVAIAFRL